mgnify:CR=1 FL=1
MVEAAAARRQHGVQAVLQPVVPLAQTELVKGDELRPEARDLMRDGLGQVTRISGASNAPARTAAVMANAIQQHLVEHTRLASVITVSAGDGYWRRNQPGVRWLAPLIWTAIAPAAIRIAGYYPGGFGSESFVAFLPPGTLLDMAAGGGAGRGLDPGGRATVVLLPRRGDTRSPRIENSPGAMPASRAVTKTTPTEKAATVASMRMDSILGNPSGMIVMSTGSAAQASRNPAMPAINDSWSQEAAGIIYSVVLLSFAAVWWASARNAPDHRPKTTPYGRVLRSGSTLWQLALFYFVAFGGFVAFSVYLPAYLKTAYALSPADAANRMAGFVAVAGRPNVKIQNSEGAPRPELLTGGGYDLLLIVLAGLVGGIVGTAGGFATALGVSAVVNRYLTAQGLAGVRLGMVHDSGARAGRERPPDRDGPGRQSARLESAAARVEIDVRRRSGGDHSAHGLPELQSLTLLGNRHLVHGRHELASGNGLAGSIPRHVAVAGGSARADGARHQSIHSRGSRHHPRVASDAGRRLQSHVLAERTADCVVEAAQRTGRRWRRPAGDPLQRSCSSRD